MRRRASYGIGAKLHIALGGARAMFPTPLRDEYFVAGGPWLEWIRRDPLALRRVSAGFLRSAWRLKRRMWGVFPELRVPLLVVLGRRDVIVDNEGIRRSLLAGHAGPRRLLEYDVEHYVDFTSARSAFARELDRWIRRPPS
jgi:pimeloyl-ACP methyl ester carboxylesterase